MADDIIQIAADGSGKMIDNSSLSVGSNTVYRQRFNLADPTDPFGIAKVMSTTPVGTENGLVVRTAGINLIQGASQPTVTGTLTSSVTSLGGGTDFSKAGNMTVLVAGGSGWTVSLIFEASYDNTNYIPVQGQRTDNGLAESQTVSFSVTNRAWNFSMQGFNYFRVRALSISGSVPVVVDAGTGWFSPSVAGTVQGNTQSGTAHASNFSPVITGGTDGSISRPAYLTGKGTQGAYALNTQDFKDTGRASVVLSASSVASVSGNATMTGLTLYKAGSVSSVSSYTTAKTFRIQVVQFGVRFASPSTTVAFASTVFSIRILAGSTAPTVSTGGILIQDSKLAVSDKPTANSDLVIPDGLEIPANYSLVVCHNSTGTLLLEDFMIVGYEY